MIREGWNRTAWRVAAIVAGSVVLAQIISVPLILWLGPRGNPLAAEAALTARLATLARLADTVPPATVAALAAATDTPQSAIRLAKTPPDLIAGPDDRALRLVIDEAFGARGQAIEVGQPATAVRPDRIEAALPLGDGHWLIAEGTASPTQPPSLAFMLVTALGLAIPLVLVSLWAARQVTAPLTRLASATERLGPTGEALPVPEEGTREVQQVARAFNANLDRLRRIVAERARMLAALSHDLRTPLTRLRLRIDEVHDGRLRQRLLRDIATMEAMVASTLAFMREEGEGEPVELVDVAAMLQTLCDEHADIGKPAAYDGPRHMPLLCRPTALGRAFGNLIDNAAKFGGAAAVRLTTEERDLIIDVEDDGPGIPPAERGRVFEPFYRGDPARSLEQGGVGLGLSIAQTIVAAHGGAIALHDRQPRGLRARVSLPVSRSAP